MEEKALRIHEELLTLDSHTDTPLALEFPEVDMTRNNDHAPIRVDLGKMRQGGLDGAFFAAYVRQRDRDSAGFAQADKRVRHLIDVTHQMINDHPEAFVLATKPEDAARIKKRR